MPKSFDDYLKIPPEELPTGEELFCAAVLEELERARAKFPTGTFGLWKCLAALTEEVGELNQACLQWVQEPDKAITLDDIHGEAIQVAAMAMRVVLDTGLELEPNAHTG